MTEEKKKETPVSTSINSNIEAAGKLLNVIGRPLIQAITYALPIITHYTIIAHKWYSTLPVEQINILIGTIFCFFGGVYPALFAAIEAAKHGGWEDLKQAIFDLSEEAMTIIEESKKDDELDEDGDGVKDVNQITSKEYITRKGNLVIVKMNPEKVDKALGTIYKVWLSVIAVLTVKFAVTIALAISISEFIKKPLNRYIAPIVQAATPDDYDKWIPVIFGWFTKALAMSIAWYMQTFISAVASALIGSLMISQALITILQQKSIITEEMLPKDLDSTQVDEVASYGIAALGVFVQVQMNFGVSFPLNLLLFPFEFAEYYIRWSITSVPTSV